MLPVIALIGRPNVGKSTLFNRLTRTRDALVADYPGLTRDRKFGFGKLGPIPYIVIDTGGVAGGEEGIEEAMVEQTIKALQEADAAIIMVDGRSGLTPSDEHVADLARRHAKKTWLAVNKAEGLESTTANAEFYGLGLGDPIAVSAVHGDRISAMMDEVLAPYEEEESVPDADDENELRIAVIGRPNVGKSTLINAWLRNDRMVVSPIAGTTRDAIDSVLPYQDGVIRLVDTAGQRKHGRISDVIEFVARVKAVQAFRRADVAVMVLDGSEGIVEQDMRLMKLAYDEGCALIVAVNKMDLLSPDEWNYYVERLHYRMRSLTDIPVFRVTAKSGKGVGPLLKEAVKAAKSNRFEVSTGELNRWLEQAQKKQYAPSAGGAVVKMK